MDRQGGASKRRFIAERSRVFQRTGKNGAPLTAALGEKGQFSSAIPENGEE
jgi:hypothetical protein